MRILDFDNYYQRCPVPLFILYLQLYLLFTLDDKSIRVSMINPTGYGNKSERQVAELRSKLEQVKQHFAYIEYIFKCVLFGKS